MIQRRQMINIWTCRISAVFVIKLVEFDNFCKDNPDVAEVLKSGTDLKEYGNQIEKELREQEKDLLLDCIFYY